MGSLYDDTSVKMTLLSSRFRFARGHAVKPSESFSPAPASRHTERKNYKGISSCAQELAKFA